MTVRIRQLGGARTEACARQILEVVPRAMRLLRQEMREEAGVGISVAQFRVLAFLRRNPGARLSAVAGFLGVAGATASVMVGRLVRRRLLTRAGDPAERRCIRLVLTPRGAEVVERARGRARDRLASQLSGLAGKELAELARGLSLLDRALVDGAQREAWT